MVCALIAFRVLIIIHEITLKFHLLLAILSYIFLFKNNFKEKLTESLALRENKGKACALVRG